MDKIFWMVRDMAKYLLTLFFENNKSGAAGKGAGDGIFGWHGGAIRGL